jgi:hypothetical protein
MDILKKLEDRKEKLTVLDKERTRVEVMLEQETKRLLEMGYATVAEAQAGLIKMKKERQEAEEEAERLIAEFDEKYKDFI